MEFIIAYDANSILQVQQNGLQVKYITLMQAFKTPRSILHAN